MTSQAAISQSSFRPGLSSLVGNASAFTLLFVVLGGLPFYLPFLLFLGESGLSSNNPISWYFWQNAVFGTPHIYSTYIRLHRKIKEKKVNFLWGFPCYLLFVGILAVCVVYGQFLIAATAINVWQSFHYLRQVYGVSRFVARDSSETDWQRRLTFWSYHLPIPLFVLGRWNTLFTVWQGRSSEYIIPVHIPDLIMNVCWGVAAIGLLLGLSTEAMRIARNAGPYNALPLINLLVYYVLHYFGFVSVEFFQRGFFAVTIFHAVQYMALSWMLEDKKKTNDTATGRVLSAVPIQWQRFSFLVYWAIILALASAWVWLATETNIFWAQSSMILMMAVSAHHYAVDTRIWRKSAGH